MRTSADTLPQSENNELGILEFTVDGNLYGINVAKVREIMRVCPVIAMQRANPNVEGVFKPRDEVITVIDLARYLGLGESETPDTDIFIITNFSKESYAFHVHQVLGIHRLMWSALQKPDDVVYGGTDGIATAIAEHDGRLVTVLDFEKVVTDLNPESGIKLEGLEARAQNDIPILVVDDSVMLSRMVAEGLKKAGYANVTRAKNGLQAWQYLQRVKADGRPVKEQVACVITDIEMPEMDGHHLVKLVNEDEVLRQIPVVIFSSLISEQMLELGRRLGAAGQFTKPELPDLIRFVDRLVGVE